MMMVIRGKMNSEGESENQMEEEINGGRRKRGDPIVPRGLAD